MHRIETATTGRSKCRACRELVPKGELRFGECVPNPYGDGEATYWFHPECAALKRPAVVVESLDSESSSADPPAGLVDPARWTPLRAWAQRALTHDRLPRLSGGQRAPSGRARCRSCHTLIEKSGWRVAIDIWEDGRFAPLGYVHARCATAYVGVDELGDLVERVEHFTRGLDPAQAQALRAELLRPPIMPSTSPPTSS